MTEFKKLFLHTAGILLGGILLGTVLITAVYLLPAEGIQKHMPASIELLEAEGENPFMIPGYKGSSLDNYTDALMLANASYSSDRPFYEAAMLIERMEDGMVISYSRYWHGYLVLLKPLLELMDYGKIRILDTIAFMLMLAALVIGFWRRNMRCGLVAYLLAFLSMFPIAIPKSLQFSSMFYVGSIAMLVLLYGYEILKEKRWIPYLFLITGMVTSYVDFLTYPVYTLGMSLVLLLILDDGTVRKKLNMLFADSFFWGIGYAVIWAGKWMMGSLLTGTNLFAEALRVVSERTSHEVQDEKISVLFAILRNGYIYANLLGILLAVAVVLWTGWFFLKYHAAADPGSWCLYILVACGPVIWYCVAANHSYIHYWFTFRDLAVTFFALCMIPEALCRKKGTNRIEDE